MLRCPHRLSRLSLSVLTLCFLCTALVLSACSSKKNGAEEPVTAGFECDMDVQYRDMEVKGHLTRQTAGTLLLEVTEPATLNGLSMEWDGENVQLRLHGLSFDVDPSAIPQSALGKGILGALDTALGLHEDRTVTEEGVSTKGSTLDGEFTLVSDPETGNLLSLTIPSLELTAQFSNFTQNGAAESK